MESIPESVRQATPEEQAQIMSSLQQQAADQELERRKAHAVEMERREGVRLCLSDAPKTTEIPSSSPFEIPENKLFLINLAHNDQNPKSSLPAIRVIGAYPSLVMMKRDVEVNWSSTAQCSLHKAEARVPFIVCQTLTRQLDDFYGREKKERFDRYYEDLKKQSDLEFAKHKEFLQDEKAKLETTEVKTDIRNNEDLKKQSDSEFLQDVKAALETEKTKASTAEVKTEIPMDATPISEPPSTRTRSSKKKTTAPRPPTRRSSRLSKVKTTALAKKAPKRVLKKKPAPSVSQIECPKVPRNSEVRGQTHVVLSVRQDIPNPDPTIALEPEVTLYATFDSEEKAIAYIKGPAASQVKDKNLFAVNMYEWIYPTQSESDQIPQLWRFSEQNLIMKDRMERKKTEEYEEFCKKTGMSSQGIQLDGSAPVPTIKSATAVARNTEEEPFIPLVVTDHPVLINPERLESKQEFPVLCK